MSMNISRRSFMKGAAAASLAVAASTMLTGCDMPSFDFGGIFGPRTKTITVADGETISIALTGYKVDSVCNEYLPEFKVVNNAKSTVKFAKDKPGSNTNCYTLVPTFKYSGLSGDTITLNQTAGKSTLMSETIAMGENATGDLCLKMGAVKDWTGIQIIWTAYAGDGTTQAGEPVDFTLDK